MKLHEAISELIKQFGPTTLSEKRFQNLLSDYLAFRDYPALQQVVKEFVGYNNYAEFLKICAAGQLSDCKLYADKTIKEFQQHTKFKRDLVCYVIDSYLFAFGYQKTVREPSTKGLDAFAEETSNILQTLPEQLDELKQTYVSLLDTLPTRPNDLVFEAASYFSVNAQNQLYALKLKISVIADKLGQQGGEWCDDLYKSKLFSFAVEKKNAVETRLSAEKNAYTTELEKCIIKPNKSYITKSGRFSDDADLRLKPIEETIEKLYAMLGISYDNFCGNEKERVLEKYIVSSSNRTKQILFKIVIPAAAVVIAIFSRGSYLAAKDDISAFEQNMSEVRSLNEEGLYAQAISKSLEARNQYTASFMASSYKGDAMDAANVAFKNICAKCEQLIADGKYYDAKLLIDNVPASYLTENEAVQTDVIVINGKFAQIIPNGIEELIQDISKNGGKLTSANNSKLDELLKLEPKNYWLNFIKNKQ